jgi:hypothetical protein
MDFADFDLQAASEAGTWLHLDLDGTLYVQPDNTVSQRESDKPCRVKLRGLASSGVMALIQKVERLEMVHQARLARAKDDDIPKLVERHQEATIAVMSEIIVAAVADWENIIMKGEAIKATPENVGLILGPKRMFFKQVYEAILERRRFLKSAAQG